MNFARFALFRLHVDAVAVRTLESTVLQVEEFGGSGLSRGGC